MICAHDLCTCEVPMDGEFCSPSCRTGVDSGACFCGHAECTASKLTNPVVEAR